MFLESLSLFDFLFKYGYAGVSLLLLALVVYLLRKLATNHLFHLDLKLDGISKSIENVSKDIKEIKAQQSCDEQRIAKLEGKLE